MNFKNLQVVTGGQYDVDMKVLGPSDEVLYQDVRKQYDSFNFKAKSTGSYRVINFLEFQSFLTILIFIDFLFSGLLLERIQHILAQDRLYRLDRRR